MFPLINLTYACANLWLMYSAAWGICTFLLKNVTLVDVCWSFTFPFLAMYLEYYAATHTMRSLLVTILISLWGLRLGGYLLYRNHIANSKEDIRYKDLRVRHGKNFSWYSYFNPFMLTFGVSLLVSLALVSIYDGGRLKYSSPLLTTYSDWIAIALFAVGIVFEVGADFQLFQFKSNPKNRGKILTDGFFSYTRHPNYFGSACVFWSMFFFSHAQGAYWTIIAPLVMTANLLQGTGVALTESYMVKEHPQYRKYQETTSSFIPMPPKERVAGERQRVVEH